MTKSRTMTPGLRLNSSRHVAGREQYFPTTKPPRLNF